MATLGLKDVGCMLHLVIVYHYWAPQVCMRPHMLRHTVMYAALRQCTQPLPVHHGGLADCSVSLFWFEVL
jgi:hypothetical protein